MDWDSSFEDFKNYLKLERGLSINSIKSYEYDLNLFRNYIKSNHISETPINCKSDTLKDYLYNNLSNKKSRSQARSISALKSYFNYLIFEGHIQKSPISDIESPKLDKKLPEVLTETEISKLIQSCDLNDNFGQRNRTIIEVLYGTGIRVSELINLKLSNIFFKENIMKITGKGNKSKLDEKFSIENKRGVLREAFPHWTESETIKPLILSIAQAHISHGGNGAYYVYLRKKKL